MCFYVLLCVKVWLCRLTLCSTLFALHVSSVCLCQAAETLCCLASAAPNEESTVESQGWLTLHTNTHVFIPSFDLHTHSFEPGNSNTNAHTHMPSLWFSSHKVTHTHTHTHRQTQPQLHPHTPAVDYGFRFSAFPPS